MCADNSKISFDNYHLTVSTDKPHINPLLHIAALKGRNEKYSNQSYLIIAVFQLFSIWICSEWITVYIPHTELHLPPSKPSIFW